MLTEQQAIARLKRGDIQALAVLVEAYQVKALRAAYLITQDRQVAEDVVQNAFLNAYHGIRHFDVTRPFGPWFMRSVVNAALQAVKGQGRTTSLESEELAAFEAKFAHQTTNPADSAEASELREAVQTALDQLSPEQRATIVLRYYLDMSDTEISTVLASPVGTIKWRLHQAKQQLRGLLHHQQWQEK